MSDPTPEPIGPQDRNTVERGPNTPHLERYTVPQAARRLGITERATRKRIAAGTLAGTGDDRAWTVEFAPPSIPGTTEPEPGGAAGPDRKTAGPEPGPLPLEERDLRVSALLAEVEGLRDQLERKEGDVTYLRGELTRPISAAANQAAALRCRQ